jgi:hypothetical protein
MTVKREKNRVRGGRLNRPSGVRAIWRRMGGLINQMKKILGASMTLVMLLVATSFGKTANEARIKAVIPFDFSVEKQVLPAGTYVVTQVRDGLYQIQREDRHGAMASMQTTALGGPTSTNNDTKLIFNKYGDQYFLSQFWASGQPEGRAVLKSHSERELLKKGGWLARGGKAPEEVSIAALD